MTDAADDVRVTNAVESDGFVLEIFDKGAFESSVEVVLQKDVKGFDDNRTVRRLGRGDSVAGHKYLGITAFPKLLADIVSPIQTAVN